MDKGLAQEGGGGAGRPLRLCIKCQKSKDSAQFSGNRNVCKSCVSQYQKDWYKANKERISSQQSQYYNENRNKILTRCSEYFKENQERLTSQKMQYYKANRDKVEAHRLVREALDKGTLTKSPCAVCGNPKVEGHHSDYSKPLEVVWLCRSCHAKTHRT